MSDSPAAPTLSVDAYDALIEDLETKLEWPENQHYSTDDLAHIQKSLDQTRSDRDRALQRVSADPAVRFAALQEDFFDAARASSRAAIDVIAADVRTRHPRAALVVIEPSDQGDYGYLADVVLEDGSLAVLDDDDADLDSKAASAAGWLSFDDPRGDWSDLVLDEAAVQAAMGESPAGLVTAYLTSRPGECKVLALR